MELFDKTKFATKKELFKFLVENKDKLIAQKKAVTKFADGISVAMAGVQKTFKAVANEDSVFVKAVINTTNVMDSHDDVHIPGIWDKSLRENKRVMHIQEHQMQFDKIISDGSDLKAFTQSYSFKGLGFDLPGNTEALVFDSDVRKDRNDYMFDQYKQGNVNNHSVGMRYVKLVLAINDEDEGAEFEAWNKYIEVVANKAEAEKQGYFWAVTEAKVIEGSAVPIGSNTITPTLEVKEPLKGTQKIEPVQATQKINRLLLI